MPCRSCLHGKAQARVAKLADRCNEGDLTPEERREYEIMLWPATSVPFSRPKPAFSWPVRVNLHEAFGLLPGSFACGFRMPAFSTGQGEDRRARAETRRPRRNRPSRVSPRPARHLLQTAVACGLLTGPLHHGHVQGLSGPLSRKQPSRIATLGLRSNYRVFQSRIEGVGRARTCVGQR